MQKSIVRPLLMSLTLLLSLSNFSTVQADQLRRGSHGKGHHSGPHPGHFIEKQAERLGLDDQTRQRIRQIADESHTRGQTIQESLRQTHTEMRQLLEQDMPDEAAVLQQAEKIGKLRTDKQKNRLTAMLQIRALLTPAQRQTLTELRREDRPPRRDRRGKGRWRVDVCRQEISTHCPDAEPGRASLQCLLDNWEKLAEDCQSFLDRPQRWGRGPRQPKDAKPPVPAE